MAPEPQGAEFLHKSDLRYFQILQGVCQVYSQFWGPERIIIDKKPLEISEEKCREYTSAFETACINARFHF